MHWHLSLLEMVMHPVAAGDGDALVPVTAGDGDALAPVAAGDGVFSDSGSLPESEMTLTQMKT